MEWDVGVFRGFQGVRFQDTRVREKYFYYIIIIIIIINVIAKCNGKFDCLVNEMLYIRMRKPTLNVQTDSIRAKVFV